MINDGRDQLMHCVGGVSGPEEIDVSNGVLDFSGCHIFSTGTQLDNEEVNPDVISANGLTDELTRPE